MNILLIGYNRPALIKMHLENLKKQKIDFNSLYIVIDGPKEKSDNQLNHDFWDILLSYKMPLDNIKMRNKNFGCRYGVKSAIDWFFSKVDEGLILEDDCQIGETTLDYFEQSRCLLNLKEVFCISGSNPFKCKTAECISYDDYRCISEIPLIWGWYTTSENWYGINFKSENSIKRFISGVAAFSSVYITAYFLRLHRLVRAKKLDTWDIDVVWHCIERNKYCIYPNKNQIINIGDGLAATNLKMANASMNLEVESFNVKSKFAVSGQMQNFRGKLGVAKRIYDFSFYNKLKLIVKEFACVLR